MNNLALDLGKTFLGASNGGSHGSLDPLQSLTGISLIVSWLLKTSFVLAGLILLFYFILGGIGMISSAGESDPQKAEAAKKSITSALIGFIIVFTSYWIVKLIGQLLGIPEII